MVVDARSSGAHAARVAIFLVTASCYCGAPPEPPLVTPIAYVEVVPSRVSVRLGTQFVIQARLWDEWGNRLPDSRAGAMTWEATGVEVVSASGGTVVIAAKPPLPPEAEVVASIDGKSGAAEITVLPPGPAGGTAADWIESAYTRDDPPVVVLIDGVESAEYGGIPRHGVGRAFVREAPLGGFDCPPLSNCAVTLFSPRHAISHTTVAWTSSCDFVTYIAGSSGPTNCNKLDPLSGTLAPLEQPLVVPVVVWKASSKWGLDNQIEADLAYVSDVFGQGGLGFILEVKLMPRPATIPPTYIRHRLSCQVDDDSDITEQLAPVINEAEFTYNRITVVYVDAINHTAGDPTGLTCPWHRTEGSIVLMSANGIGNSTLAHELGHALGQWSLPGPEHPDVPLPRVEGIDRSNLLWSSEVEWAGSARRHLTLGQLAQMSFASFSFLKRSETSLGEQLDCGVDPNSVWPCPAYAKEMTR